MFTLLASASFLLLARGEYYEKVNQQVSFAAANAKCQEVYGTDLASIHCEADFTSALDICGSSGPCWLGGVHGTISKTGDVTTYEISTDFTTGSWQWMDGAEWDYSNWGVFNEIAQGEGITGEYFTCIWEVWHEENPVGVNDCGTNELFYPICHSPTACEQEYEAAGYNDDSAMYRYTGGCQQHFEYISDQAHDLSFSECSAKCLAHSDWCRSFTFGKNDIEGLCTLYGGVCTPIFDENDHSNLDMFTPILSSSATFDFTGRCPQHFEYGLWQDKSGDLTVEECSLKCSVDGAQWCRSFAYGKAAANLRWCNLYGGVCNDDDLPDSDSAWGDFGVPIFSKDDVEIIPLYTGRCQEHFEFGLLQDTSGTYTFDTCSDWCVTNKNWCKSFTFGKDVDNRNWCNLYSGVCTPQANDYLDWDVFELRGVTNAQAICSAN